MIEIIILLSILIIGSLFISYVFEKFYLKYFKDKIQQPLLAVGPEHSQKNGTPTMGGLSFWLAFFVIGSILALISIFLFPLAKIKYLMAIVLFVIAFGYALLGFYDDYLKVTMNANDKGLTPWQKLLVQLVLSLIFDVLIIYIGHSTSLEIYALGISFNIGMLYYVLVPIMIIGMSNATNITDGLDGLLTSNIIFTLLFLSAIAFLSPLNYYFTIVLNFILIGVLLGFLILNQNPAKIFMGDTGSLALGSYIAMLAILLNVELMLILFGIIYVIEILSIIMQVSFFKYTKKKNGEGRRILLMAPIHHHLEKKGLSENKIVFLTCVVNIIIGSLGILFYVY